MPNFVHLHCHTEFSLLDGAIRPKDLVSKAKSLGMPAVAITDHGNLYGAIGFFKAAKDAGVKPIIGCEAYIAPGSMREKSPAKESAYHLTLLATNETGYRNLVKIASAAHLEGFYYKPRVDHDFLASHAEGLIALSGCLKGEIVGKLLNGDRPGATAIANTYIDIFGRENFFVELHDHGLEAQRRANPGLRQLASDLRLATVAANDVHFLEKHHHASHDVMLCIGTGSQVLDEKRLHYAPELYFKTADEMAALFPDLPEALENTLAIADRCNLDLEFGQPKYPSFDPPNGQTREEYLRDLCWTGLRERYGERATSDTEVRERLEYELSVIEKTGFVSYFLIVWDFIRHAREKGIPVGPGRGSAAGSLIAYVLQITDIDPLRFGLIFERFLNPERISPPDIDVDFCMDRRGEVIDYVRQKYGERCVSQIVTFGTLGAKSVIRDVARVLGWGYGDADRLAKMIPNELNITLEEAAKKNADLGTTIANDPSTRQLWDHALVLEGLSRNTGIHAAGVVIGDRPLDEYIPLCRGKDNEVITQYAMEALTDLGMLKMDFLGLKTLTVLEDAVRMIRKHHPDFDLARIPMDDPEAFAVYNRGETLGVFQMESGGITNFCKRFDINSINDIIALGALYRPGPMKFIDDYIARKKGLQKVAYHHPLLEKICAETYGIMVYQEQVQRAANVLAGYSLGEADLLRRAMGKKDREKMAKERSRFVDGCGRVNNIPPQTADAIFDFMAKFAEYGFNKSHSAAYGWVSYQTAYVKAHFPVEFMAALLTFDASTTDRLSEVIAECTRMGIRILPPDINSSLLHFTPADDTDKKAIRFGLASIKNIGTAAMEALIAERDRGGRFSSLNDFCSRLDSRTINRKIAETLVCCGAMDTFGIPRAQLFADLDQALAAAAIIQKDRATGQAGLFGDLDPAPSPTRSQAVEPWSIQQTLSHEKDLLGFYVTGHPLESYAGHFDSPKITRIADALKVTENTTAKVAGIIVSLEKKFTRSGGKPFGIVVLEDFTGSLEVTVWDEDLSSAIDFLVPGKVVSATVRLAVREESLRATASKFAPLKERVSTQPVRLRLDHAKLDEPTLDDLVATVQRFPGKRPLELEIIRHDGQSVVLEAAETFSIGDEHALRDATAALLM